MLERIHTTSGVTRQDGDSAENDSPQSRGRASKRAPSRAASRLPTSAGTTAAAAAPSSPRSGGTKAERRRKGGGAAPSSPRSASPAPRARRLSDPAAKPAGRAAGRNKRMAEAEEGAGESSASAAAARSPSPGASPRRVASPQLRRASSATHQTQSSSGGAATGADVSPPPRRARSGGPLDFSPIREAVKHVDTATWGRASVAVVVLGIVIPLRGLILATVRYALRSAMVAAVASALSALGFAVATELSDPVAIKLGLASAIAVCLVLVVAGVGSVWAKYVPYPVLRPTAAGAVLGCGIVYSDMRRLEQACDAVAAELAKRTRAVGEVNKTVTRLSALPSAMRRYARLLWKTIQKFPVSEFAFLLETLSVLGTVVTWVAWTRGAVWVGKRDLAKLVGAAVIGAVTGVIVKEAPLGSSSSRAPPSGVSESKQQAIIRQWAVATWRHPMFRMGAAAFAARTFVR